MADDRKLCTYTVAGIEHTALLDADDQKRHKARVVSNKAHQPENKAAPVAKDATGGAATK